MATDIAVVQSPTGKLALSFGQDGDVQMDSTEQHVVVCQLLEHRAPTGANVQEAAENEETGWWADEIGNHGSELHTIRNITSTTPSRAEALAQGALDDLANEGRIVAPRARARRGEVTGRLTVEADYTTHGSGPQTARVSL
jgi:phage gp46-like protein